MHSPWRLDKHRASLQLEALDAQIDLDQPASGLGLLKIFGRSVTAAQILGVELPWTEPAGERLVEAYARGSDLIATYADSGQPSFRWQVYWRALADRLAQAPIAIEAIVSVQTALLDSWPQLTLHSVLPTAGVTMWRTGEHGENLQAIRIAGDPIAKTMTAADGWGCFGFDLPDTTGWYVEMVHPDDFSSSSVEDAAKPSGEMSTVPGVSLRHLLFRERLEKGVILRSRVLALMFAERPTSETITEIGIAFSEEELPLTA